MSFLENNKIELKVGDVFRRNGGRKHYRVINMFEYNDTVYFNIVASDNNINIETWEEKYLCGADLYYGTTWGGIVELNGKKVRGSGGVLLKTPKEVKVKKNLTADKNSKVDESKPLTDFQKFVKVQRSGVINMTDIVQGARLAGLSEDKYIDILWNYEKYKNEDKYVVSQS